MRGVAADARILPFPDGSFDTSVVGFSLCTIPEPEAVLGEMARVAKADGSLRFLEHVRSPRPRTARRQDWFHPVWERVSGGCRANQDTERILQESPWEIDAIWRSDTGGLIQGSAQKAL